MTSPIGQPPGPRPDSERHAELRAAAQQLEAVFFNQLMQAMRESVPQGGLVEPSRGEQVFTAMLDERLSQVAAERLNRGLGEALYRQMVRRLDPPAGDAHP